ncbi:MAG: hypothetical protein KF833_22305 [Verrucomicrobiae bacterium]|nr:hypothetical protein [Verrucomicrobiae bacterium]
MLRILLSVCVGMGLLAGIQRAEAFSLFGEVPAWYTDQTGRDGDPDIYGPMNLGEEHRWVVPQIHYAFDESFLNYFGQDGVNAVEGAIAILNALPPMSEINIDDYPLFTMRVNYRARDLGMMDLRAMALKILLEQVGLAPPQRFVYTLRARWTPPEQTNYLSIMRNFDPVTFEPTPYINGQLWTYLGIYENQDGVVVKASTIPEPVDPLILAEPVASSTALFAYSVFGFGSYFTGLTRDDVGGLRYIYRPENQNVETLPPDATGAAGAFLGGGGGAWTPISPPSTNIVDPGDGTGGALPGVPFYPQGLRPGINRLQFVRPGLGVVYQPNAYAVTNQFVETVRVVITNGVERTISQRVTRVLTAPDILFSAEDLAGDAGANPFLARTAMATSNDAINGSAALSGPGQYEGPGGITFNKVGAVFVNQQPNFLYQPGTHSDFVWGSFDGSTNAPIAYPTGTSIRAIENRVFGGR